MIYTRRDHHPLPVGARVHHRNQPWSLGVGHGSWGWGSVLEVVPQHDRTFEYRVQRDEPIVPGGNNAPTWWASYHIDEHEIAVAA